MKQKNNTKTTYYLKLEGLSYVVGVCLWGVDIHLYLRCRHKLAVILPLKCKFMSTPSSHPPERRTLSRTQRSLCPQSPWKARVYHLCCILGLFSFTVRACNHFLYSYCVFVNYNNNFIFLEYISMFWQMGKIVY